MIIIDQMKKIKSSRVDPRKENKNSSIDCNQRPKDHIKRRQLTRTKERKFVLD